MAEQFGEAILAIRAQDAELRKTLTQDEQLVRQSTDKMQGDLNKLKVPLKDNAAAAYSASSAFGVLSAQSSALGGTMGMLGGQIAGLGSAVAGLGKAILGPVGIVLALAAAVSAVVIMFQKWKEEVRDADEALKGLQDRLKAQEDAIKKRNQALQDQIILESTGRNRALERMLPEERANTLALAAVKAAKALRAEREALGVAEVGRVVALRQETQILLGQKTAYDFIESSLERQARLARDKAQAAKQATDAAQAEQAARRAVAGPQTPGEARQAIDQALDMITRQERMVHAVNTTLESMLKRGVIDQGRFDQVTAMLGLPARPTSDPAADRFRSGGVEASSFRGGRIAFGAVSVGDSEQKKQTQILQNIKTATDNVKTAIEQTGGAQ